MSRILSRVPRRYIETWHKENLEQSAKTSELWKKLTFFVAAPAVALVTVNTYLSETEHAAHYQRPEFINYDHLRIQNVPFPWGDRKHPLLFNPKFNATRDGYEDE